MKSFSLITKKETTSFSFIDKDEFVDSFDFCQDFLRKYLEKSKNESVQISLKNFIKKIEEYQKNQKAYQKAIYFEKLASGNENVRILYDKKASKLYASKKMKLSKYSLNEIINTHIVKSFDSPIFLNFFDCLFESKKEQENQFDIKNTSVILVLELAECSLNDYKFYIKNEIDGFDSQEKEDFFYNIFIIAKTLIQGLKILKNNDYLHSDIKNDNILLIKDQKQDYIPKICDFETLISYEEYQKNPILKGCTKKYMPPAIFDNNHMFFQGKNLSKENFFKLDIYSFAQCLISLISLRKKLAPNHNLICKEFKDTFLKKLLQEIPKIPTLEEIEELFESFLKNHNINLKEKKISINHHLFLSAIYSQLMSYNGDKFQLMRKYISIGFYDKPLKYCLNQLLDPANNLESPLFFLGHIYSMMKNSRKAISYYQQYEKEVADGKIPLNEGNLLFVKSQINYLYLSMGNEERKIAKQNSEEITKKMDIQKCDFRSFYVHETLINLLFIFIETQNFELARKMVYDIDERLKKELDFKPNYQKAFEEEDINNANFFFYRFYNLHSLMIRYSGVPSYIDDLVLMEKAMALSKTVFAENTSNLAQIYNNIGCAFLMKKDYTKALSYHEKSYEIRKALYAQCSDYNLSWVLLPYANAGTCYYNLGNYEKAYLIAKEITEKRKKILAEDHIELLQIKIHFMKCALKLNKINEAKRVFEELKAVFKENPKKIIGKIDLTSIENEWEMAQKKQ